MTKETITLFYRDAGSDKFYTASIEEVGADKFLVPFTFGRRGTSGQSGDKLKGVPASFEKAKKAYDQIVGEKIAKGYKPGPGMAPAAGVAAVAMAKAEGKPNTGINCQLLNPIPEEEMERCLKDSAFGAQEKFDGRRMLLKVNPESAIAINRKGQACGFPAEIEAAIKELRKDVAEFVLDGEAVGTVFHAFDLLSLKGQDLRELPYRDRYAKLRSLLDVPGAYAIKLAHLAVTPVEKKAMLDVLRRSNCEGIVFKRMDAEYRAGRPASGGSQLKFKFYATASCVVTKVNAKNSVALGLLDDKDEMVAVGNCTIPVGKTIPAVDSIVEIRYLYSYPLPGGSLYQPVFLGVRDDVGIDACKTSQLKFKAEGEEE